MEQENINALDEINKGSCMGMDVIKYVLDKVEDEKLKEELNLEFNNYKNISEQINQLYSKYSSDNPHETNVVNKAMTWYGIQMKTLTDTSNSKIAELLLQGVNMGIIEGRKILNNKKINNEVKDIISKYVTMQEDSVERLKKYL